MPKPFNFLGQKLILSVCLLLICSSTVRPQASGCPEQMLIQNGSSVRLFITLLAISQVLKKIRLCRPFQTGLLLMPAHHHWTRLPTTLTSDSCRVRCHHWRME